MRNVSMQFGKNGGTVQNRPGLKFLRGGEVTDDTAVVLSFSPGGIYVLITKEWNASTGAYRGHRASLIAAPEEDVFGTVAPASIVMAASTNAGVTFTHNNDSTTTIKQSSTTYNFRYALYRVDGSGGNSGTQSEIETYTGTYSVTPSTSAQSLSTANKRMTANVEVGEIPAAFGQLTQDGTDLAIS